MHPSLLHKGHSSSCICDHSKEHPCGPDSMCLNRTMLVECNPDRALKNKCENQQFQKKQYVKLRIFKTPNCGWGLKTVENISKVI